MLANINIHPSLKGDVLNIFEVAAFETDFIVILDTAFQPNFIRFTKIR